jgi:hypothetical protein
MANELTKLQTSAMIGFTAWIIALCPIHPTGKAIAYIVAIGSTFKATQLSRELEKSEAQNRALKIVHTELEQEELSLYHRRQQQHLQRAYFPDDFQPEVDSEVVESLEHLYTNERAVRDDEFPFSIYMVNALNFLMEEKGETFVIENILGCRGRRYQEGKIILSRIFAENDTKKDMP